MDTKNLTIKDFDKAEIKKMCRDKFKEIKAELGDLRTTKENFIAMAKTCAPADDFSYSLGLEVINGLIEVQNCDLKRFQRYYDIVSGKYDNRPQIDLEAIKNDVKCQDLMPGTPTHQTRGRLFYKAPWRNETKASLVIYLDSNSWWDFGMSEGGSVIDLAMKLHDISFKEALNLLKNN